MSALLTTKKCWHFIRKMGLKPRASSTAYVSCANIRIGRNKVVTHART